MSWTVKGAQRMARLISLAEMGKLHPWITHKDKMDRQPFKEEIRKGTPSLRKDDGDWLKAGLPALYGPHQNRPWFQILRALAHGVLEV